MKPTVLFLDLDCTLIEGNFDELWEHARTQFWSRNRNRMNCSVSDLLDQWAEVESTYLEECREGRISHLDFGTRQITDIMGHYGAEISPDDAELAWQHVLQDYLSGVSVFPDVVQCLEDLSDYRLVVLTGGMYEWQKMKFKASGLVSAFETILSTEEAGTSKLNRDFFVNACSHIGCAPEACVNVGDNPEQDVIRAIDAGLRAVWLNRESAAPPQEGLPEITSLSQLPPIISAMD